VQTGGVSAGSVWAHCDGGWIGDDGDGSGGSHQEVVGNRVCAAERQGVSVQGCRPLDDLELEALREALSRTRFAERNLTILAIGVNSGFRISEILSLRRRDVVDDDGGVRPVLVVRKGAMKGKKENRGVKVNAPLGQALACWLEEMAAHGRTRANDRLFLGQGGRPLTRYQFWRVLRVAKVAAGLRGKIATHSMRKTFANRVYEHFLKRAAAGEAVDAFRATSRAMGHKEVTSTDKYLSFRSSDVDAALDAVGWS